MQSSAWTSMIPLLASSQRGCSASCCRPRPLCAVSGVPQTTPFARDLSLLSPCRTVAPAFLVSPPQPKCSLKYTPPPFLSAPVDTPPSSFLAAWTVTRCAASTSMGTAPTPPRASPSCARGSRAAPSPRSSAPPHRSARSTHHHSHRLCRHLYKPPFLTPLPALTAFRETVSARMPRKPSNRRFSSIRFAGVGSSWRQARRHLARHHAW